MTLSTTKRLGEYQSERKVTIFCEKVTTYRSFVDDDADDQKHFEFRLNLWFTIYRFCIHSLPFALSSHCSIGKIYKHFTDRRHFVQNFFFFFCVCVVFKVENHVCVCYLDIDFRHSNKQILFILPRQIYFFFNILFVVVHFSLKCTPIGFHRNDINKFHACRARHKDERKLSQRRNHLNNILNKTFSFQFFRSVVSRRR